MGYEGLKSLRLMSNFPNFLVDFYIFAKNMI